jgi:CRP/FNR family transcriptional regulator, anaerobic regulatory protein
MLILGVMTAEERVAVFLLDLSRRLEARGQSPTEFIMRMTRREIGSHLAMTLETVSRMLSKFQIDGLISATHKHICVLDHAGLRKCASHHRG